MKRDQTLILRLSLEIREETKSLDKLMNEFDEILEVSPDSRINRARASILHDFYTGIERIFIRIAEELNGGVPRSEHWHRQLLTDMTLELPGVRPAVVSSPLSNTLLPYLRFRHLFRNLYGFSLDSEWLSNLEAQLRSVYAEFTNEIERFIGWMTGT